MNLLQCFVLVAMTQVVVGAPQGYSKANAGVCVACVQAGADALAGVGNAEGSSGPWNGFARGPSAGAGVQIGANTGYGLKAGVWEVGGDIGGVGGAKVGLNVDTGFTAGTDGVGLKVLGTGSSFSSKGVEFCLLGSCIWIG